MKTLLWAVVVIGTVGALLAGFILVLLRLRETTFVSGEFFRETMAQIIAGLLIALIASLASFWSAYGLYKLQENDKVASSQADAFIKIKNEVSENRLTLGQELKREKPLVRNLLKTEAWDAGKYQTPIKTPLLLDGLKLLYDLIEKYNWHTNFLRFKVMEQGLTQQGVPETVWKSDAAIMKEVYSKLEEFENLTTRELILLGHGSQSEFEKRFGPWQAQVDISFFKQAAKDGK
ncbi:MAG: hypothetical protein Q7J69_04770 [Candidatus Omnitrophota bacterium]|nr:hypothetical protein [Candidatus Omnitrophota bacterium]